jgi:hypothetical protein
LLALEKTVSARKKHERIAGGPVTQYRTVSRPRETRRRRQQQQQQQQQQTSVTTKLPVTALKRVDAMLERDPLRSIAYMLVLEVLLARRETLE